MNVPTIENRWTTGNILTLGGLIITLALLIFGGGAALAQLKAEIVSNREAFTAKDMLRQSRDAQVSAEINAIRADTSGREARLRLVEGQRIGDAVEVTALRREITELKADLREVSSLLRMIVEKK